jgi:hypothetical protein
VPEVKAEMMSELAEEVGKSFGALLDERAVRQGQLVTVYEMVHVGRVEVFSKDRPHCKVAYLRTWWDSWKV